MSDFEKVYSIKFNIKQAEKSLDKLEKVLLKIEKSNVFKQMKTLNKTLIEIDKSAKKAGKTIKNGIGKDAVKSLNRVGKSGKKAAAGVNAVAVSADRANISLSAIGRNLNRYVLAPMAALGGLSLKASTDMNKGIASISTLVDQTPEQLRQMRTEARGTMVDFAKGTEDVTGGLYQVISALGESTDNVGQLKEMTKAAVAGISSTKASVDLLTAAGKAYNDTSIQSIKHTSDLAFQTVKLGVTTFPELAASMGKVLPLAAQFETSQEELFGTMATLTGVTGNTAEVTTQLASIYTAFMKPSEAMEDGLAKINKQNEDYNFLSVSAMVKTLGFKKSIDLLGAAAGGSEEELMAMFRRKEAILGILPLISSQSENYTKKLAAMEAAAGATDEAFRKQTEGINKAGFELERTKQRIIVFAQRIGDRLIPILGRLMDYAEPFLEWLVTVDEESIDTAIALGKVVAQFVLLVNAFRVLNTVGKGVTTFIAATSVELTRYGTAAGAATVKTNGLTKAMSGLQAGIAVLGALALGYTLGDLIDKGIVQPSRKKEERKQAQRIKDATGVTLGAGRLKDQDLIAKRERLLREYEEFDKSTKAPEENPLFRGVLGEALKKEVTGGVKEKEQARTRRALLEAIGTAEEELEFRKTGLQGLKRSKFFDPSAVLGARQSMQTYDPGAAAASAEQFRTVTNAGPTFTGEGSGGTVNMNSTFNVQSSQAMERTQRLIDRGMKALARDLERDGANVVTK